MFLSWLFLLPRAGLKGSLLDLNGGDIVDPKAREARNSYMRKWRRENKEKVKRYNKAYWEKKAKKLKRKGDKK